MDDIYWLAFDYYFGTNGFIQDHYKAMSLWRIIADHHQTTNSYYDLGMYYYKNMMIQLQTTGKIER